MDACPDELRQWEWHYLKNRCHPELRTISFSVRLGDKATFSRAANRIVINRRTEIKVWDMSTDREVFELAQPTGFSIFTTATLSADGRFLAAGGDGKKLARTLTVWDTQLNLRLHDFPLSHDAVSADFSPDGLLLAVGAADGTVKLLDLQTGQEHVSLEQAGTLRLGTVAFSPDGKRLAGGTGGEPPQRRGPATQRDTGGKPPAGGTGEAFRGFNIWDVGTGKQVFTVHDKDFLGNVAWSPDGRHLASGLKQMVKIWDSGTGKEVSAPPGDPSGGMMLVAFSPDGQRLASGSQDGALVRVWDRRTSQELFAIPILDKLRFLAYSPDGKFLAAGGNKLKLFETAPGAHVIPGGAEIVWSLAFSPDSKQLAAARSDGTARIYDAATGGEVRTLAHGPPTSQASAVAFNPDGSRLASAGEDGVIKLWDPTTGRPVSALMGHRRGTIHNIAFSPDGRRLASAGTDQTVKLWDEATGQELLTLRGHSSPVFCLAFSPGGQRLASATWDFRDEHGNSHPPELKVWDLTTGQEVLALAPGGSMNSVTFSSDGCRIIGPCDGKGGALKVWDATTGEELSCYGAGSFSTSLALSRNEKRAATAGNGGDIQIWDLATGQDVLTLRGHTDGIESLVFSPDGRRLASASMDRSIRIWDGTPRSERPEPAKEQGR